MKKITIVTHNGNFHSDDIFAVAVLRILLEKTHSIEIKRTRDENQIKTGDYVVDVGFQYKPKERKFDHHQNGLKPRKNGIPYAAFGLVWKEYGKKLCNESKKVWEEIDRILVQPIDAIDNGIEIFSSKFKGVYPYSIGNFFQAFNHSWKEEYTDKDNIFVNLTIIAKSVLEREIVKAKHKFEAFNIIKNEYRKSKDKRVIVFKDNYPWEEILNKFKEPLFAVYPNKASNTWSIKGVNDDLYSFKSRRYFPESWAGKKDGELQKITGVEGALFCHKKRFIASAKTLKDAIALVSLAL